MDVNEVACWGVRKEFRTTGPRLSGLIEVGQALISHLWPRWKQRRIDPLAQNAHNEATHTRYAFLSKEQYRSVNQLSTRQAVTT